MSGAPQVAMRSASQSWQFFFPSQTLQVICFSFTKPSDFCLALRKRAQYVVVHELYLLLISLANILGFGKHQP